MKFFAKTTDIARANVDMLVLCLRHGKTDEEVLLSEDIKRIDKLVGGIVSEVIEAEKYQAAIGKTMLIHARGGIAAKRLLLVGVGKPSEIQNSDWLKIAAVVGRKAKEVRATKIAFLPASEVVDFMGATSMAQGIVQGMLLGTYTFGRHKNPDAQKNEQEIEEVHIIVPPAKLNSVDSGISAGVLAGEAVSFARDLVNEPPSVTTPTYLGDVAKSLAKKEKNIAVTVFGPDEIKKMGMGGLLGIAQGSDQEPRFIKLAYNGLPAQAGGGKKTIALVGKGITFDTGGLSLKPPQSMETMKLDMAGAAAILGVFAVIARMAPKVNVVGLLSVTENMPSGKAIKPGDIVRAMSGKTIEVLNTDAEGRVVLADALSYAVAKIKPDVIIDFATLTGACMVALGEDIAGIFVNQKALGEQLKAAAKKAGEALWELPLAPEYKPALKSSVADIKNISASRYGGAINGALFLQEFVPDEFPWAHLDIAGPAFAEKDAPLTPLGGTGFGVGLILEYLRSW